MDQDYIDKLSEDEKAWLSRFNNEYISGSFEKTPDKKRYSRKNLHKTKKERQECYGRNNARNRDTMSNARAQGLLYHAEDLGPFADKNRSTNPHETEDTLITMLDGATSEDPTRVKKEE